MLRSMLPTVEREEKLMIFFYVFEKWWEMAHLRDVIEACGINNAKLVHFCNLQI